jgi:hypothetical protein
MRLTTSVIAAGLAAAAMAAAPGSATAADGRAAPTATAAQAPQCIDGAFVRQYLSKKVRFAPDISYLRFEWSARFCRNGNGWLWQKDDPGMTQLGGGSVTGVGLNLGKGRPTPNGVTYRGEVRDCIPLGAGYKGISFTGQACLTVANVQFSAFVNGNQKVQYSFAPPRTTGNGAGSYLWTRNVL